MKKFTLIARDTTNNLSGVHHVEGGDIGDAQDTFDELYPLLEIMGAFAGHIDAIWWEV
jgi:hypothetical protein